ncbi:hypothetical protein B0H21DRAFT_894160 [Amylocystis lapponica]|nr:hypothetical protein B0H21DRAFT_894160 [Amylocystis lapponica]
MAPKKSPSSLLFHPKKKNLTAQASTDTSNSSSRSPSPAKPRPPPRLPKRKDASDDERPPPPEGPYSEFKLMSSALNGWKYDVMKFDSRRPVDIMAWPQPVKLNRKEPRRAEPEGAVAAAPQAVGPMQGPDGKPVIGADGRVVMVDAEGRPIRAGEVRAGAGDAGGEKGKEKEKGKKRFQKKTRQVFLVPEATRQLRKEERVPWVMEDAVQKEVWVGTMEEVAKSETHAMFMPAAHDVFKFVPAHRWYKFHKKPNYRVPTLEEAEALMTRIQKNKDPERWLLRRRNGQAPSEETTALFKKERAASAGPSGASLVHTASHSLGPGGRRLKTVDNGTAGLFGDDDDDDEGGGRKRKMERQLGAEGDMDELDFEEGFADDEEKMEPDDQEDEEAKELEERLKREYKTANKQREGYIDESDEEDEEIQLTGAGKNLQKTLKKLEKDGGYDDSDDEKNPYASSEEEEEEEIPPVQTGPAIIAPEPRVRPSSQTPAPAAAPSTNGAKGPAPGTSIKTEPGSQSQSRATSPVPAPSHGGHSIVAKRATSPKVPKGKANGRASSPLAGGRATAPNGSRATSPIAASGGEGGGVKGSNKRKATDDVAPVSPTGTTGAPPKTKKRKVPGVELEDAMVIEWLKNTPDATTRDCIHHFTPYLTDEAKKTRFTALVKEVAQLSKGVLVLRPAYRDAASGARSVVSGVVG